MLDEGDTWPPPNKRSKWEIMLSPKPCAVCGANARYLTTESPWIRWRLGGLVFEPAVVDPVHILARRSL